MKQLSDGTIRAIVSDSSDRGFSVKDSTDGGKTWGDASMDLSALEQLNLGDDNTEDDGNGDYAYVGSMTIDADGDLAFVYTQSHSETKDNVTMDSTVEVLSSDKGRQAVRDSHGDSESSEGAAL